MRELPLPAYRGRSLTAGIVHFGVGGFHRSHQAVYQGRLLERGVADDWAIRGVGTRPADARMREVLAAQDGAYTVETRHADGTSGIEVIASIVDVLLAPEQPDEVLAALCDPAIRLVTLTITEGGYHLHHTTGTFDASDSQIADELADRIPTTSPFGLIVAALRHRRSNAVPPFTVVSCDNIQGNGDVARMAVVGYARLLDAELADWIDRSVDFPSSMVDRITPVTTPADVERVHSLSGLPDAWPVVAEPFTQWIIEDTFKHGRPPWELVGVQLVEDVVPYEKLKLRVLNGAHQALAYFGLLLRHRTVAEAASDADLAALVRRYLVDEVVPTLDPVPGVDVAEYVDTVLRRFANPSIGDTLERLATAASDRLPVFIVPTALDNAAAGRDATLGAAIMASWWAAATEAHRHGEFRVDDPVTDRLVGAGGTPEVFLDATGGFAASPSLSRSFREICEELEVRSARDVVTALGTAPTGQLLHDFGRTPEN